MSEKSETKTPATISIFSRLPAPWCWLWFAWAWAVILWFLVIFFAGPQVIENTPVWFAVPATITMGIYVIEISVTNLRDTLKGQRR